MLVMSQCFAACLRTGAADWELLKIYAENEWNETMLWATTQHAMQMTVRWATTQHAMQTPSTTRYVVKPVLWATTQHVRQRQQ